MMKKTILAAIAAAFIAFGALAWGPQQGMMNGGTVAGGGGGGGGGTVACDTGITPFSGSAPTQAVNAGFTRCAANFDFSNSFYATQSNFYDCTNSGTQIFHNGKPGTTGCTINQISDPLNGSLKVMDLHWPAGAGIDSTFGILASTFRSSSVQLTFPNMYVETTYRIDVAGANSLGNTSLTSFFGCQIDANGNQAGIASNENDLAELWTGNGATGFAEAQSGYPGCGGANSGPYVQWQSTNSSGARLPSGWTPYGYHKYGLLQTSDGATNVWVCDYVDDILQSCGSITPAAAVFLYRNIVEWVVQIFQSSSPTQDGYYQFYRVWSCANWNGPPGTAANMCNGTSFHSSTGASDPSYWH